MIRAVAEITSRTDDLLVLWSSRRVLTPTVPAKRLAVSRRTLVLAAASPLRNPGGGSTPLEAVSMLTIYGVSVTAENARHIVASLFADAAP